MPLGVTLMECGGSTPLFFREARFAVLDGEHQALGLENVQTVVESEGVRRFLFRCASGLARACEFFAGHFFASSISAGLASESSFAPEDYLRVARS